MEQVKINSVKVLPGCISCRNCESVCPSVFLVSPTSKVIAREYAGKESEILQAEALCPVHVIKVDASGKLSLTFQAGYVLRKKFVTHDVLELEIETQNFSAQPGQYVSLQMHDAYGKFSRSYSLASFDNKSFTLTVKILKKGRGSKFLKKLQIGEKISFLGGLGLFTLQKNTRRKVCIATGTGLAPMIPILEQSDPNIEKIMIFGARKEEDFYYQDILKKIPNTQVIYKVSQSQSPGYGTHGRVTDELSQISKDDDVYICGNPEMVQDVIHQLKEKGHPKTQIFHESFTLSQSYPGFLKYHLRDGNIPYKTHISWGIILFSLLIIPSTWLYNGFYDRLYDPFFLIQNYMGFLYDVSWWSVVGVMAIRPLSDIFPKIKIFKSLCYFRKAFGILSATIIVSNWLGQFVLDAEKITKYFQFAKFSLDYNIIARTSEWSALILLLTSNSFFQKKLGIWWKRIQRLSYAYFISGGIMAAQFAPYKIYIPLFIVGVLYLLAEIKRRK